MVCLKFIVWFCWGLVGSSFEVRFGVHLRVRLRVHLRVHLEVHLDVRLGGSFGGSFGGPNFTICTVAKNVHIKSSNKKDFSPYIEHILAL